MNHSLPGISHVGNFCLMLMRGLFLGGCNTSNDLSNCSHENDKDGHNSSMLDSTCLMMLRQLFQPSNLLADPLPQNVVVLLIVGYSFIILLSVLANSAVVVVIGRHRLRNSITDMYIFSLAISDMLVATLNMPFQLYFVIANEWLADGKVGEFLCKFTNYVQGVTIVACVLTLTAIAIDRYIVICQPSFAKRVHSRKSAIIGIVVVWITALCVLSPHLVFQRLDKRLKVTQTSISVGWICAEFYTHGKRDGQLYSVFVYVFLYCIPVLILTFTYCAIAYRLWLKRPVFPTNENQNQLARNDARKKKITKLLIVLVLAFTVLWLPFFTFSIYNEFARHEIENSFRIRMAALQLIGYSNCFVNPIIYTFMNNSFQKEFVRRFRCSCLSSSPIGTQVTSLKTDSSNKV